MAAGITAKTTGIKEIDQRLKELAGAQARKVVRSGVNAGLAVLAREMRAKVQAAANLTPREKKLMIQYIGKRFAKNKAGDNKGVLAAKAGFAVGKKMPPKVSAQQAKSARGGRPGVGISARNIHWLTGTDDRETGSKKSGNRRKLTGNPVRFRGRMPAGKQIPAQAATTAAGSIHKAIDSVSRAKLEEVVAALNRK